MSKRLFDLTISIIFLLALSPLLMVIAAFIALNSKGSVFYKQLRVGKNNHDFFIYKFRTMKTGSDKNGLLTIGGRDPRITSIGYYLRKYKLDELPQLLNVLNGSMSIVGPRPEVRKYVELYDKEQLSILNVKPGITDYASILYANENELLANSVDPEQEYIANIMPAKLKLNKKYIAEQGFFTDLKIIWLTIKKIWC